MKVNHSPASRGLLWIAPLLLTLLIGVTAYAQHSILSCDHFTQCSVTDDPAHGRCTINHDYIRCDGAKGGGLSACTNHGCQIQGCTCECQGTAPNVTGYSQSWEDCDNTLHGITINCSGCPTPTPTPTPCPATPTGTPPAQNCTWNPNQPICGWECRFDCGYGGGEPCDGGCGSDPCCGDPCCGDPYCGDPCRGDPYCGQVCYTVCTGYCTSVCTAYDDYGYCYWWESECDWSCETVCF